MRPGSIRDPSIEHWIEELAHQAGDGFVVLADPDGNELCVIEPGNDYLAGTGYLGEVASDGTRDVGLFWRDALGWPLVWDANEQTADRRCWVVGAAGRSGRIGQELPRPAGRVDRPFAQAVPDDDRLAGRAGH